MQLSKDELAVLSELLDEGLDLPEASRGAWVEGLSEPFAGAKAILRKMLAQEASGEAEDFLDTLPKFPATDDARENRVQSGLQPGARLGIYLLIREIGQGGMSTVWLAQRTDELTHRLVALKLPHLHLQSARFAERFARERDILANLTHPHIAHLYDAGISAEGQPFLAIEFVAGDPLTHYCTAHQLGVDERLQLFLQVLEAVDYAHAQRVIHRDLKPSNILVREGGQVVLLDFGIAKLLVGGQSEQTELTLHGGAALTPHYASPEQIRGDSLGPATDVYSLGVLLYELLTGQPPYELEGSTRQALEAAILSTNPRPPSKVVTQRSRTSEAGSVSGTLRSRLRGDLDTIVLKALKKAPEERYPTAGAFAEDLRRYLRGDAVGARPDSPWYRLTKRARRHQSALQGAAVAGLAVAAVAIIAVLNGAQFSNHRALATPIDPKSVAVLPFLDMSEKKDQEYLADGLSEELIDMLTKIPNLRIPARTSSFYFKGKQATIAEIGKALSVAHVLEGSVRKSGTAVRITAQLIRVDNGYHLWSKSYDRKLDDIFKIQDEIAGAVVAALKTSLVDGAASQATVTTNNATYALYLQARALRHGDRTKEQAEAIVDYLHQAIRLDPAFAPAWAELARALVYQSNSGYRSTQSVEAEARHAADEALTLSPNLAIAHVSIGIVRLYFDLDFRGADRAYRQALLLDPRNPDIYVFLSDVSRAIGNAEESQTLLRSAINLDPLDELYYGFLGDLSYYLGRFTEAEVEYRKALAVAPDTTRMSAALGTILFSKGQLLPALEMMQREPDEEWREWGLSIVLYALGRRSDADSALTELKRAHADDSAFNIAEIYAFRKEIDPAFDWLDRAYQQRDPSLTTIKTDPWVLNLKPDPRWKAFLHKLRLPE